MLCKSLGATPHLFIFCFQGGRLVFFVKLDFSVLSKRSFKVLQTAAAFLLTFSPNLVPDYFQRKLLYVKQLNQLLKTF